MFRLGTPIDDAAVRRHQHRINVTCSHDVNNIDGFIKSSDLNFRDGLRVSRIDVATNNICVACSLQCAICAFALSSTLPRFDHSVFVSLPSIAVTSSSTAFSSASIASSMPMCPPHVYIARPSTGSLRSVRPLKLNPWHFCARRQMR